MTGAAETAADPEFRPDYLSPPGQTLEEILEDRTISQTELARRLGASLKHVNQIINGVATISADTALALERVLGVSASFWLKRDAVYQGELVRREQQEELLADVGWAQQFPVDELKQRGFIPKRAAGAELVASLLAFLGLATRRQWVEPAPAYRKSLKIASDSYALSAWLRVGDIQAEQQRGEPFNAERFQQVLQDIRPLTRLHPREWEPRVKELCAACGVVVVIVDTFAKARVNGAARWHSPHRAILQLSLRYKWEDIFWFTFFHEACHLLHHRKRDFFLEPKKRPDASTPQREDWLRLEQEADRFASRTLIPPEQAKALPGLALTDVPLFAQQIGIAPAIVVGRMQHDKLIPYSHGNYLRRQLVFT